MPWMPPGANGLQFLGSTWKNPIAMNAAMSVSLSATMTAFARALSFTPTKSRTVSATVIPAAGRLHESTQPPSRGTPAHAASVACAAALASAAAAASARGAVAPPTSGARAAGGGRRRARDELRRARGVLRQPHGQLPRRVQPAEEGLEVVGPALRDVDVPDRVLDHQVPAADPRDQLAEP